ncbi:Lysosomal acid glucosylceramidase [Halotydeus destructor]|nr:Lysosomal acid glucosylceramidase [Halotydeus destructor]
MSAEFSVSGILYNTNPVSLGSWEYAEVYTLEMLTDIQHWTAAWVDWNLALDEQGGPNYLGNFIDSPIIVNASANEFYKHPMFYTIGHLSKFVPPGSRRIQVKSSVTCPYGGEDCSEKVTSVAFVTPDGSTVLIVMNRSEQSLRLSVSETATGKQYSKSVSPRAILSFRS